MRPEARSVDIPALCIRAAVGSVDSEKRTVKAILSTGAPVERTDWWTGKRFRETLSLQSGHVRLDRLNAGAPLLNTHSAYSVESILGSVEPDSARLEGKKLTATIRFSKRDAVTPVFQDVLDGHIRFFSLGYRVYKFEETEGDNKIPVRKAVDWEPFEASLVPMPADVGARVRSGDKSNTNRCVILVSVSDADRARALRLAMARQ